MKRLFIFCFMAAPWISSQGQDLKSVVEKYFQSVGGRDNIEQIKTSAFRYTSFGFYPKTDTSYLELKQILPQNQISRSYYTNGKLKYESIIKGDSLNLYLTEPYPSVVTKHVKESIFPDLSTEILHLYISKKLKYSKPENLNGIEYSVLKATSTDLTKSTKTFYFDNNTGLLAAQKVNDNVTFYKDYRVVKSVAFPFIHEQCLNALLLNKEVYEKVEFNIDLGINEFKPKSKDAPPLRKVDSKFNKVEFVGAAFSNGNFQELISHFRGKRILIDIWATWCGPCKYEFTKYNDNLYAFLKDKGIELLFISLDKPDKEKEWKKDLLWFNLNGYHLMAGKSLNNSIKKEINDGNPMAIPRYVLINEKGEILSKDMGKPSSAGFRDKVLKLLD